MSGNIKCPFGDADFFSIDVVIQDASFFIHWAGNNFSTGRDDDGITRVYPLFSIRVKPLFFGKVFRDIAALHKITASHNPAAAFAGNMLQASTPAI